MAQTVPKDVQCEAIIKSMSDVKDNARLKFYISLLLREKSELARQVLGRLHQIARQRLDVPIQRMRLGHVILPRYDPRYGMNRGRKFIITDISIIVYNWYEIICINRVTMKRRWQRTLKKNISTLAREHAMDPSSLMDNFIRLDARDEFILVIFPIAWLILDPITGHDMSSEKFRRHFLENCRAHEATRFEHIVCKNKKGHDCLVINVLDSTDDNQLSPYLIVVSPEAHLEVEEGQDIDDEDYAHDYFDPITGELSEDYPSSRRHYVVQCHVHLNPWTEDEVRCSAILNSSRLQQVRNTFVLAKATHLSLVWLMNGIDPEKSLWFNFEDGDDDEESEFAGYLSLSSNLGSTFVNEHSAITSTSVLSACTINGSHLFLSYKNPNSVERSLVYEMWKVELLYGKRPSFKKTYRWEEQWRVLDTGDSYLTKYACEIKDSWHCTASDIVVKHDIGAKKALLHPLEIRDIVVYLYVAAGSAPRMVEMRFLSIETIVLRWCDLDKFPLVMHHYVLTIRGPAIFIHVTENLQHIYLIVRNDNGSSALLVLHMPWDKSDAVTLLNTAIEVASNGSAPDIILAAKGALVMAYSLEETRLAAPLPFIRVFQDSAYEERNGLLARVQLQSKEW